MTLRIRLFLAFGTVMALLVLVQWWWVRGLTRDLSAELDQVASSVGHSVASFFVSGDPDALGDKPLRYEHRIIDGPDDEPCSEPTARKVKVIRYRLDPSADPFPPAEPDETGGEPGRTGPLGGGVSAAESDADPAPIRQLQIHVEHSGGDRFLFLAGPDQAQRIAIPEHGFRHRLELFSRRLVLGTLGLLALGLVLAGVVAHRVSAPLRRLSTAAREVGEGAWGTEVAVTTRGVTASGEVGQAIAAFNQMSGRLAELDARNRELRTREHLGEIGEIARGLAHTLRNPLNALGLSVEELAVRAGRPDPGGPDPGGPDPARPDPPAEPQAADLASSARRQIRRIDRGIRSFLALASQSGGAASEIRLADLVQDVALEALQDARGKVRLEVDAGEDLPPLAVVEPEIRAVFQALVVNAVEASPEGGSVEVRLSAAGDGRARLEVDDRGPGLPAEVREKLFTPHLSTKANGSGMGLFLAHRIATNRYRGRLELRDRPGGGTRAVLELGERHPTLPGSAERPVDG